MTTDPSKLVGRAVAHYQIEEYLGGGGMGLVYRATDQRLGRQAALKFLPATVGRDASAKERFLQEARAASALDHPNICTVFEIGESDGQSFIAMAFYAGRTFESMIERGPLDVELAINLIVQVGEGLTAAHSKGIIHRDIKPANVVVTKDSVAKILDFGLAKFDDAALLTQPGAVMGTAAYMSPEQASGGSMDHRVDIWALGAVLYELLSGQRPFPGSYPQAILYGILNTDPEPLSGLRSGLPLQLIQVAERALAKDPDDRYARVSDMLDDLRAVQSRRSARSEAIRMVAEEPVAEEAPPQALEEEDDVLHILCVDDEPELELLMQQRFRKKLRAGDWKFVFALDGEEALRKLEEHPEVGLILTDLNMPRMDGLTLLGKLAELDRPLRTVVVSAYGDLEKIRTAMNRGAFDFVTKPIDFKDLDTTINKASQDLEVFRRAMRSQEQLVSVRQELDVARRIQEAISPVSFPSSESLEVYGFSAPASEVSGTFFDAFGLPDGRVALVLGDAAGRGVTAALLMAMGQTFVKGLLQQGSSPAECLTSLNHMLFADGLANVSLRVLAAVVDPGTGEVAFANAGHQEPSIRRASGILESPGSAAPAVWTERDAAYSLDTTRLEVGDALVLASRGLAASKNAAGQAFTEDRLASIIREAADAKPTALIRGIVRSVQEFIDYEDPREDLTLLAVRRIQ